MLLAEGSYTRFCTYMSSWWPPRIENEPDGIPCGLLPSTRKNHVCQHGKCVHVDDVTCLPIDEKETFVTSGTPERRVPVASTERIVIKTKNRTQHAKEDNIAENVSTLNTTENATKLSTEYDATTGNAVNENSTERKTMSVGTEKNTLIFGTQHSTTASVYTKIWGTNETTEDTATNMTTKHAMKTNTENTTNTPTMTDKMKNEIMTNSTQISTTKITIETLATENTTGYEETKGTKNKATRVFTLQSAAISNVTMYSSPRYQTDKATPNKTDHAETQSEMGHTTTESMTNGTPDYGSQDDSVTNTTGRTTFKTVAELVKPEEAKNISTTRNATTNATRKPSEIYEQKETSEAHGKVELATEHSLNYTRLGSLTNHTITRITMESSTADVTAKYAAQNTTENAPNVYITKVTTIRIQEETAQTDNTRQASITESYAENATTHNDCTTEYTPTQNTTPYVTTSFTSNVATVETKKQYGGMKNLTENATRTNRLQQEKESVVVSTTMKNAKGELTTNITVEYPTKTAVHDSTIEKKPANSRTENTTTQDTTKYSTGIAKTETNFFIPTNNTAKNFEKYATEYVTENTTKQTKMESVIRDGATKSIAAKSTSHNELQTATSKFANVHRKTSHTRNHATTALTSEYKYTDTEGRLGNAKSESGTEPATSEYTKLHKTKIQNVPGTATTPTTKQYSTIKSTAGPTTIESTPDYSRIESGTQTAASKYATEHTKMKKATGNARAPTTIEYTTT
nr:mucin-12-like isoform X3 [Rhipicephalus microplus]